MRTQASPFSFWFGNVSSDMKGLANICVLVRDPMSVLVRRGADLA